MKLRGTPAARTIIFRNHDYGEFRNGAFCGKNTRHGNIIIDHFNPEKEKLREKLSIIINNDDIKQRLINETVKEDEID